jgi:uncharacterized membrane protein HdeD (DUF308 family)
VIKEDEPTGWVIDEGRPPWYVIVVGGLALIIFGVIALMVLAIAFFGLIYGW